MLIELDSGGNENSQIVILMRISLLSSSLSFIIFFKGATTKYPLGRGENIWVEGGDCRWPALCVLVVPNKKNRWVAMPWIKR